MSKGFVTYIPANAGTLGFDPRTLAAGMLAEDVMQELDGLDEDLLTTWAPVVEEDS